METEREGLRKAKQDLKKIPLYNGLALSKDLAIAVGNDGLIQVSTVQGMTWETRTTNTEDNFNAVALNGEGSVAIAVGDGGMIQSSGDKGMTWEMRTTNTEDNFNAVALNGEGSVAIAVGNNGMIQSSDDKGMTWEILRITNTKSAPKPGFRPGSKRDDSMRDFNAVALSGDGSIAIAVGDGGMIQVFTAQGKRWTSHDAGTDDDFNAVALSENSTLAIAVGDNGMIRALGDPGKGKWMLVADVTDIDLNMVVIDDSSTGAMAIGSNGRDSSIILKVNKQNGQQFLIEKIAGSERNLQRRKEINSEISEIDKGIHTQKEEKMQLDAEEKDLLDKISKEEITKDTLDWIEINFVRGAILLAVIFLSQHLFGLIRYSLRLASFYDSCRDAFRLSGEKTPLDDASISMLEKILRMRSPKDFDFGRSPPGTMISQAIDSWKANN